MKGRGRRTLLKGSKGRSRASDAEGGPPSDGPSETLVPPDFEDLEDTDAPPVDDETGPTVLGDAPATPGGNTPRVTDPPAEERTEGPALHPDHRLVGERVAEWVIDAEIGRSQECLLVRAHHHKSERMRAMLKILDAPRATTEHTRKRLVREGEVLFPLDHPGIASVRNLRLSQTPPFLELELVPGQLLDRVLSKRKTLFMAEALELVEQLLGTLAYLHERGVAHRDVHPRNLIVRPDGGLTLLGFGFAVEGGASTDALPPTALPYLPPEFPDATAQSADLYAAGALLYALLTGKAPGEGPERGGPLVTALSLRAKRRVPFLDPGERFHEDLRSLVRDLTHREPANRLTDASAALDRLKGCQRSYAS